MLGESAPGATAFTGANGTQNGPVLEGHFPTSIWEDAGRTGPGGVFESY